MRGFPVAYVLASFLIVSSAFATTYNESGDSGQTPGSAQAVPLGTTQINGSIGYSNDVDMYQLTFNHNATVIFFAGNYLSSGLDDNLILLDGSGHPLWGDDDSGASTITLASKIVWNVTPGTYYLAYGVNNIYGYNASSTDICDDDSGNCSTGPYSSDVVTHVDGDGAATGSYVISISEQQQRSSIPALSEWGMIMLSSLLAFASIFTLRRQRQ